MKNKDNTPWNSKFTRRCFFLFEIFASKGIIYATLERRKFHEWKDH